MRFQVRNKNNQQLYPARAKWWPENGWHVTILDKDDRQFHQVMAAGWVNDGKLDADWVLDNPALQRRPENVKGSEMKRMAGRLAKECLGEGEQMVDCPVCKGSKESPHTGNPCPCCGAKGKITKKMSDIKAEIRRDLGKRLKQLEAIPPVPKEQSMKFQRREDPLSKLPPNALSIIDKQWPEVVRHSQQYDAATGMLLLYGLARDVALAAGLGDDQVYWVRDALLQKAADAGLTAGPNRDPFFDESLQEDLPSMEPAGGSDDPWRQNTVKVPYDQFDFSGKRGEELPPDRPSTGQMIQAMQDWLSDDELKELDAQAKMMEEPEFEGLVRDLYTKYMDAQHAPPESKSRFNLKFDEAQQVATKVLEAEPKKRSKRELLGDLDALWQRQAEIQKLQRFMARWAVAKEELGITDQDIESLDIERRSDGSKFAVGIYLKEPRYDLKIKRQAARRARLDKEWLAKNKDILHPSEKPAWSPGRSETSSSYIKLDPPIYLPKAYFQGQGK